MNHAPPGVADVVQSYHATTPAIPAHPPGSFDLERSTGIVGKTPMMRVLQEQIVRFAKTTATVVIRGETGTGKELVARALHTLSPRAHAPFVAANVAALTESLLQSELFGHERGAFTGATYRHKGLFEQAHMGTLFLDEIGELSMEAQASLLRVLETREVRPVGADRTRPVNVRLVVATHRPLAEMVDRDCFREDLFYRLHTLVVRIPPLRHRVNDLPFLAAHVLQQLAPEVGERTLDHDGLLTLGEYGWPGNVRQLQNVIRRAVVETDDPVLSRDHIRAALAHEVGADREKRDGASVANILAALDAENWNVNRAAKSLGLPRSTLRTKIRRAGLIRER
jgi:DNA-binding NtrC family response regulator